MHEYDPVRNDFGFEVDPQIIQLKAGKTDERDAAARTHDEDFEVVEMLSSLDENDMTPWFPDALRRVMDVVDSGVEIQAQVVITAVDILQCFPYDEFPLPHVGIGMGSGLGLDFAKDGRELEIEILPDSNGVEWLVNETSEGGRILPGTMKSGSAKLDDPNLGVYLMALGAWLMGANAAAHNVANESAA